MSEVTWTDPLVFGTGLTNPSSDLRDVRKVEGGGVGLYSRIHLCFWYFLFFPPKFSFSAFCSHLRLWCWVWAARWRSWRGCPASFGWPCTAAPLPPGQGLQLPVQWCGSGRGGGDKHIFRFPNHGWNDASQMLCVLTSFLHCKKVWYL